MHLLKDHTDKLNKLEQDIRSLITYAENDVPKNNDGVKECTFRSMEWMDENTELYYIEEELFNLMWETGKNTKHNLELSLTAVQHGQSEFFTFIFDSCRI